jgi:anti-sigma B factor antagonist
MSLTITIQEKKDNSFLVVPAGEINTETCQKLEKEVAPILGRASAIVFEMKDVTYISSMGLGAIFRIKQAMEKKQGTILLANPQPQIRAVFESMKILPDHMFASLEEADESLDAFLDGVQKGRINPANPKE